MQISETQCGNTPVCEIPPASTCQEGFYCFSKPTNTTPPQVPSGNTRPNQVKIVGQTCKKTQMARMPFGGNFVIQGKFPKLWDCSLLGKLLISPI